MAEYVDLLDGSRTTLAVRRAWVAAVLANAPTAREYLASRAEEDEPAAAPAPSAEPRPRAESHQDSMDERKLLARAGSGYLIAGSGLPGDEGAFYRTVGSALLRRALDSLVAELVEGSAESPVGDPFVWAPSEAPRTPARRASLFARAGAATPSRSRASAFRPSGVATPSRARVLARPATPSVLDGLSSPSRTAWED